MIVVAEFVAKNPNFRNTLISGTADTNRNINTALQVSS